MFMEYRLGVDRLLETLEVWNGLMTGRGRVHLIACGGTGLTLLGIKDTTIDVDFLVPEEKEYTKLVAFLTDAGYEPSSEFGWKRKDETMVFDLYLGKKVYATELLTSPLEKRGHRKIKEWSHLYLGVLNSVDLIISKMFRGTSVDHGDCLLLLENETIVWEQLEQRFRETASFDVSKEKLLKNLDRLKAEHARASK
jgi:hypothetical protein